MSEETWEKIMTYALVSLVTALNVLVAMGIAAVFGWIK